MLTARQRLELAALLLVGITPFFLNGLYNLKLTTVNRAMFWSADVASWVVLPAIVLSLGRRRGLFTFKDLGLSTKVLGQKVHVQFILLMVIVPLAFVTISLHLHDWVMRKVPQLWTPSGFHYQDVIPPPGPASGWWRLLAVAYLAATAGFVEEVYYRAMLDRLTPRGRAGGTVYVMVSATVFAGAHWEGGLPLVVEAGVIGAFAAGIYRYCGNIWPIALGQFFVDWHWFAG